MARHNFIDLTGRSFGRLTVLHRAEDMQDGSGRSQWFCSCLCGNQKIVTSGSLRSGGCRSCGCLKKEQVMPRRKPGLPSKFKREHKTWQSMMQRCYNPNSASWKRYGGRGITVCDRWHKFENFLADMGASSPELSIDRIDNNAGYSPENCRWATRKQNARNTSKNRLITYKGETACVAEWAERTGLPHALILQRLKSGWDAHKIFTTPPKYKKLPPDAVRQIRSLYESGLSQSAIGDKFQLDQTTVSLIVSRKSYKDIF